MLICISLGKRRFRVLVKEELIKDVIDKILSFSGFR